MSFSFPREHPKICGIHAPLKIQLQKVLLANNLEIKRIPDLEYFSLRIYAVKLSAVLPIS
jgi:hypothetical protein